MDLSPGTSAVPVKGPQAEEVIGIGSPWLDMFALASFQSAQTYPAHAKPSRPRTRLSLVLAQKIFRKPSADFLMQR
ncbi:hypothetical protein GCM10007385_20130 [Tateyamaria omphalii]|nr:hypothetical protein GCM10007385_20130 [Tateyamaria omphalii]